MRSLRSKLGLVVIFATDCHRLNSDRSILFVHGKGNMIQERGAKERKKEKKKTKTKKGIVFINFLHMRCPRLTCTALTFV